MLYAAAYGDGAYGGRERVRLLYHHADRQPIKEDAKVLNELGEAIGELAHITWLLSVNFKKKNGYLGSVELSREYEMYRQDYCGCVYSKQERERKQKNQEKTPLQERCSSY